MKKLGLLLGLLLFASSAFAQVNKGVVFSNSPAPEAFHWAAGNRLGSFTINWAGNTTSRWIMIFDAKSASSTLSATPCTSSYVDGCRLYCAYAPNSTVSPSTQTWQSPAVVGKFGGLTLALSTGGSCFSYVADSANDDYEEQIQ